MPKSTDIFLKSVEATTTHYDYRTPIKFGGRVVTSAMLLNITVDVETRSGLSAQGFCNVPLGNAWGWPSQQLDNGQTLAAMQQFANMAVDGAGSYSDAGHPLEITHQLAASHAGYAAEISKQYGEEIPRLAQLVCASPVEGAIHDAYGKVHNASSYNLLGEEFCNHDISAYLNADFAGEYLSQYTLREVKPQMPLYHLVGALDPLTSDDLQEPVGDGLPETLQDWVAADGLTHLKIKLNGDDLEWDVARVAAIEAATAAAQQQRGCTEWCYSLDFNEKCASVEYVLDFLARAEEVSPAALQRVQYIEQPTHRDLRANPENRMHRAAAIKPVVIDESLVDFESLLLAREQGYSGVALKACKGHSEAMLMGAAAQKYNMFLCVQDLTCVGASLLHSASLAARIPTVAAIEANGRQYCPAGNSGWEQRFPGMFNITTGVVQTSELAGNGLGF